MKISRWEEKSSGDAVWRRKKDISGKKLELNRGEVNGEDVWGR